MGFKPKAMTQFNIYSLAGVLKETITVDSIHKPDTIEEAERLINSTRPLEAWKVVKYMLMGDSTLNDDVVNMTAIYRYYGVAPVIMKDRATGLNLFEMYIIDKTRPLPAEGDVEFYSKKSEFIYSLENYGKFRYKAPVYPKDSRAVINPYVRILRKLISISTVEALFEGSLDLVSYDILSDRDEDEDLFMVVASSDGWQVDVDISTNTTLHITTAMDTEEFDARNITVGDFIDIVESIPGSKDIGVWSHTNHFSITVLVNGRGTNLYSKEVHIGVCHFLSADRDENLFEFIKKFCGDLVYITYMLL